MGRACGDADADGNAQPALLTMSVAVLRVLEAEAGIDLKRDVAFRRRSLARRISALAAANTLLADAVRLCAAARAIDAARGAGRQGRDGGAARS